MSGEIPRFGLYHDEPILPPSKHKESLTVEQFQEKYPFRYRIYGQTESETEVDNGISPEVIVRRLQMLNNLDRYITAHGGYGKGRVLREKQLAVFRDTYEFLETGETEGFIEAPTGFGKTVLFSEVIKATNQRTLVVVPSKILVDQTYKKLSESNPTLDIGRYYSDKKERDKQVTVTTYHSLVISCGGVRPEDIDLLILDEVHQSLTDARIEAVERFANPVKLGFTATPEYTRDKRVENLLNNQIHMVTLKEAVETGLLCSFSVYLAETDVDLSSVKVDAGGDYNERELEEAINIYSRNKSAVELYKKLNEERKGLSKAVTYCVSIKHAREVARMFNEAGIQAEAIWSDQNPDERRRILEAYKRGEIKVLTNVNVLTEGFDDPQAGLCLNLRPTLSKVVAKQRGGRVLRLDPDNSKKHAIVVDYLDRNENKKTSQVTFAQVAEGASIINPVEISGNGKNKGKNGENGKDKVLVDKEWFDLEGLRVITSSQEVLRIVSELEILQNQLDIEGVQENDFILTYPHLIDCFQGDPPMIMEIAQSIYKDLQTNSPESVTYRLNKPHTVPVVTDRELFIDLMISRGMKLKAPKTDLLKETDFAITKRELTRIFIVGNYLELTKMARQIKESFLVHEPELVTLRTIRTNNGLRTVEVITDRNKFVKSMVELGARVKESQLKSIQPNDFAVTIDNLSAVFRGDIKKLLSMAQQVLENIQKSRPGITVTRLSRRRYTQVVTEPNVFIALMLEKGATLREKAKPLGNNELVYTTREIRTIFKGRREIVAEKAKEVIEELRQEGFDIVTTKYLQRSNSAVITDKARFVQAMIAKGMKLKDNS